MSAHNKWLLFVMFSNFSVKFRMEKFFIVMDRLMILTPEFLMFLVSTGHV